MDDEVWGGGVVVTLLTYITLVVVVLVSSTSYWVYPSLDDVCACVQVLCLRW